MVSVLVFQLASCFCFDAMIVVTLVGTPADGASPHLVKPFSITCKTPRRHPVDMMPRTCDEMLSTKTESAS